MKKESKYNYFAIALVDKVHLLKILIFNFLFLIIISAIFILLFFLALEDLSLNIAIHAVFDLILCILIWTTTSIPFILKLREERKAQTPNNMKETNYILVITTNITLCLLCVILYGSFYFFT